MHRHQRGGAGGLDRQGGTLEVEDVADAGGEEVLVVAGMAQQEHARAFHQRPVGTEVEVEVAAHAAAREDADASLEAFGRVACGFQRLPSGFEEVTMLRIEDRGFLRREAEEFGVETVEAVERGGERHVVGILQRGRAFARSGQFLGREAAHGRAAFAEVFPIGCDIGGAGQVRGHPHDGDVRFTRIHVGLLIVPRTMRAAGRHAAGGTRQSSELVRNRAFTQ